jgi:ribosome-associated translation inhibitor RaiA
MNFQLKHRHVACPPDLVAKIEDKMQRFARVIPDTAYVELCLKQLPKVLTLGDKEAEVIVDIPGVKPVIRFVSEGMTFLEAIDRVLDQLDEALSHRKQLDGDHSYRGVSPKEQAADEVRAMEQT